MKLPSWKRSAPQPAEVDVPWQIMGWTPTPPKPAPSTEMAPTLPTNVEPELPVSVLKVMR